MSVDQTTVENKDVELEKNISNIAKKHLDALTKALDTKKISDRSQNPFLFGFSPAASKFMSLERSLLSKTGFTCEDIICDVVKLVHPDYKFIPRIYPNGVSKKGKDIIKKDNDCCYESIKNGLSKIFIFEIKTGGKLDKNKAKEDVEALYNKSKELSRLYPSSEICPAVTILFVDKKQTGLSQVKKNCKLFNIPLYMGDEAFTKLGIEKSHMDIIIKEINNWSVEYNRSLTS
jgi:hypothetical protein